VHNVITIMRRDLKSYFSSMMAYVIMMIFLGILGYFFYSFTFIYARVSVYMGSDPSLAKGFNPTDGILRPLFMNMSVIMLLIMPILSMRSFSEEKKQGTMELLFTYPVRNIEIVLGKYAALVGLFKIMLLPTLFFPLFLYFSGAAIHIPSLLASYAGILLLGTSCLSLTLFASALSETQTIAGVLGFGALLMFWLIGWSSDMVSAGWLSAFLREISMIGHYRNLIMGIINTNDILYYLFFIIFFLYLTLKVIEKRDWR